MFALNLRPHTLVAIFGLDLRPPHSRVSQGLALLGMLFDREARRASEQLLTGGDAATQAAAEGASARGAKPRDGRAPAQPLARRSNDAALQRQLDEERCAALRQGLELADSLVAEVARRAEAAADATAHMLALAPPAASDGSSGGNGGGASDGASGESTAWLLALAAPPAGGSASIVAGGLSGAAAAVRGVLEVGPTAALLPTALMASPTGQQLQADLMAMIVSLASLSPSLSTPPPRTCTHTHSHSLPHTRAPSPALHLARSVEGDGCVPNAQVAQ
eukprot:361039-Chlamydomonas_euryale.AAC.1